MIGALLAACTACCRQSKVVETMTRKRDHRVQVRAALASALDDEGMEPAEGKSPVKGAGSAAKAEAGLELMAVDNADMKQGNGVAVAESREAEAAESGGGERGRQPGWNAL